MLLLVPIDAVETRAATSFGEPRKTTLVADCFCDAVYTYEVEVYTGAESTNEMNGRVHIALVGERGDTGNRTLLKPISSTSDQMFRPQQVICLRSFILCMYM